METLEYIIIGLIVLLQAIVTTQIVTNLHNAKKESQRQHKPFQPACVLIVPCKGLDEAFDQNIESFFRQDYSHYHLRFVVQDRQDPAYTRLLALKAQFAPQSPAKSVQILIAGAATMASQKLHNLLFACKQLPEATELLAFADSDACAGPNWLRDLTRPLQMPKNGATSGYRCFIPSQKNLATIALAALNAKICQFLGKSRFNLAWGGSMAIPLKSFKEYGIEETWSHALSDDLSLSTAVRKHKQKMVFVPTCMIASFVSMTWAELFEFSRRQFLITRIYTPLMWWFALVSSFISGFGVLIAAGLAVGLKYNGAENAAMYAALAMTLFGFQVCRMLARQQMIASLLPGYRKAFEPVQNLDAWAFGLLSGLLFVIVLSSAFGRTITWRGIKYRMRGPRQIDILNRPAE